MSKLTDTKLRSLKPLDKPYKISDGDNLFIHVSANGTKTFRLNYFVNKKRKTISLGTFPALSLAEARIESLTIKKNLKQGIDPLEERKEVKEAIEKSITQTFENLANEWLKVKQNNSTPRHRQDIQSKLERYIYPTFRNRDINTITAKEMLETIRLIEKRGVYETCKKTLGICNQIFAFAIGEGVCDNNVCTSLNTQLISVKTEHYAHLSDKKELAELLKKIDLYPHGLLIKIALQIAPLVFVRPSELANAKWAEIDFEDALWTIPPERMKIRKKHLVPLSSQTMKLLKQLHEINGEAEFVFSNWSRKNKPLTIDGIRQGLRRLGYKDLTTHGFRHTASTMLNELGYNSDWIEKQLAHTGDNSVRATYNHAQYLPDRRRMMQEWADYLDNLKEKY